MRGAIRMRRSRLVREGLWIAVLFWLGALGGCGSDRAAAGAAAGDSILVLAAANVQNALTEVAKQYTAATGRSVQLVFGSSGNLTTQIEQGIPADVFLSADEAFVDRLVAGHHVLPETRVVYGTGRLALVSAPDTPLPATVADAAQPRYQTIAIANPEVAPYGRAARETLQAAGIWPVVQPRIVQAEDIAQALQFVRTGNADVGLVALALVAGTDVPHADVPDSLHAPLRQAAAVLAQSTRPGAAKAFLDYLTGPSGREILGRFGFGAGG